MKYVLILLFFSTLIFDCGKKSESVQKEEAVESLAPSAPMDKQLLSQKMDSAEDEEVTERERGGMPPKKSNPKEPDGIIEKPLDIISEASKSRLLEYTIQLNYKVESIEKAREILLGVIKKDSYIASSQTNMSTGSENMYLQVQIPVSAMYDTLLQMDKIGQLTYEDIRTQDWTEHNELQRIKLDRESLRMIRRSKATNKGSVETWNWKDREDALERSENTSDEAKMEAWKIKDHVAWARLNLTISGKELPTRIQFPNYKDAFLNAINFLLSFTYYIVWILPLGFLGYLIFKVYKWFRP